jgi:hypothetical protein
MEYSKTTSCNASIANTIFPFLNGTYFLFIFFPLDNGNNLLAYSLLYMKNVQIVVGEFPQAEQTFKKGL